MRISVTGANGFIGHRLVEELLEAGHKVTILTRTDATRRLKDRVNVVRADLTDPDANLLSFVKDCDALFHCAGELYRHEIMEQLHVEGTRRLIAAVERTEDRRAQPLHWINLSSVGAYGPPMTRASESRVVTEDTPTRPVSRYETTKTQSDELVMSAGDRGILQYTVARPTNVFGESMTNQSLRGLLSAIRRGMFFYIGEPGAMSNYVHVNDVTDALLACATSEASRNRIFNISNDWTIEDMAAQSARSLGVSSPRFRLPEASARMISRIGGVIPRFPLTQDRINALVNRTTYSSNQIRATLGVQASIAVASRARAMLQMPA